MLKVVIVWVLAASFGIYSFYMTIRANFTTGTLLLWLIAAAFAGYGAFHRQIDAFCEAGFGRVLKYLFIAGVLVFCAMLCFVAFSGYTNNAKGDEDAIIILGAGLHGEEVSDVLRRRMQAGLEAWQQNPGAVVVVTGGQGPQEVIPEALAMQRWLLAHGVPEDKIIMEDKSTSTEENLRYARALLLEAGYAADMQVCVVTNAFHCYRAGVYAQREGFLAPCSIPASMNITAVLPSYMREVLALLDLWVFKRA